MVNIDPIIQASLHMLQKNDSEEKQGIVVTARAMRTEWNDQNKAMLARSMTIVKSGSQQNTFSQIHIINQKKNIGENERHRQNRSEQTDRMQCSVLKKNNNIIANWW